MNPSTTGPVGSTTAATAVRVLRLAAAGLAIALVISSGADGQVLYGTITGTVIDASGGVLPGATVTALNVDTGVTKATIADERGAFNFSDLVPGVYDVTFQLSGFKNVVQKAARVESNAVRRVDAKLEVSGVEERIEVVSAAVALQTDRADVHITQSSKEVNELPLVGSLGRNYQSLMQVVPGATIVRTRPETARPIRSPAARSGRFLSAPTACRGGKIRPGLTARPCSTSGCRPIPPTSRRPRRLKR